MCALVPSPNAFPFASQEFALVGDTADARYLSFDISQTDSFIDDALREHINMDAAHAQEAADIVQYEGPTPIVDPLSTAMQTYRYVNRTKRKEVHGYLSLYHVKRQIAKAIMECVDLWNEQHRHTTFKIGIEVKAVFTKNHPSIQNPEADPIVEHCIMFIHRILQRWLWGASHRSTCKHWGHSSPPLSGSAWMRTTTGTAPTSSTTSLSSASTFIVQTRCRQVVAGFLFQRGLLGQRQ